MLDILYTTLLPYCFYPNDLQESSYLVTCIYKQSGKQSGALLDGYPSGQAPHCFQNRILTTTVSRSKVWRQYNEFKY